MKRMILIGGAVLTAAVTLVGCGASQQAPVSSAVVEVSSIAPESTPSEETASIAAETVNRSLEQGGVTLEYPQLTDMRDNAAETAANDLIRQDANACLRNNANEGETGAIGQTVIHHGSVASVVFTGMVKTEGGEKRRVVSTTNIDLETGSRFSTGVRENAEVLAEAIFKGEYTVLHAEKTVQKSVKKAIRKLGTDGLHKLLKQCDYTEKDDTPKCFSYQMDSDAGDIGIYLPVSSDLGDDALLMVKADVLAN